MLLSKGDSAYTSHKYIVLDNIFMIYCHKYIVLLRFFSVDVRKALIGVGVIVAGQFGNDVLDKGILETIVCSNRSTAFFSEGGKVI